MQHWQNQPYPTAPQPRPGMSSATKIVLIVVGCFVLLGGCSFIFLVAAIASDEDEVDAGPQIELVSKSRAACAKYESAPNEIRKSEIYRLHQAWVPKNVVANARGTVESLTTDQGGDEVRLAIRASGGTFNSSPIISPIVRGTALYNGAAELAEGECVLFSARNIQSGGFLERSKVCDLDYFVEFTLLLPCPR